MDMTDNIYKVGRKILYKELEPLFVALSPIRYAVVKGEVLSQQIYGDPDRRRSSDIDILIDKKNVKFLEEQLHKLGFEQKLPKDNAEIRRNRVLCMAYSHQIPPFHKDKFGFHLNVDVNYDIFWGEYEGKHCSIDEFLSDTVDMEIYGVTVKTLPIEKAFVQLVLHHYKDMNSLYHLSQHNSIRTGMFRDIYDMIKNNAEVLSSETVNDLGEQYVIDAYMYYMLFYTYGIFKDSMVNDCLCSLSSSKGVALLDCYGLSFNERKKWGCSFKERLDNDQLHLAVLNNLSQEDIKKLKNNFDVFGQ